MKYLFVCGVARTGTTLLATLLGANPKVIIGIERYKNIINTSDFGPILFEKSRFFDFRESDTNTRASRYQDHYDSAIQKYDDVIYIGDKVPSIYKSITKINNLFSDNGIFLFCHRNIYDVAASWNVRSLNPKDKWPVENNHLKCVTEWHRSFKNVIQAKKEGVRVIPFDYDAFTSGDIGRAKAYYSEMLQKLGLSSVFQELDLLILEFNKIPKLKAKRNALSSKMKQDVYDLIDMELIAEFDLLFDSNHVENLNSMKINYDE